MITRGLKFLITFGFGISLLVYIITQGLNIKSDFIPIFMLFIMIPLMWIASQIDKKDIESKYGKSKSRRRNCCD